MSDLEDALSAGTPLSDDAIIAMLAEAAGEKAPEPEDIEGSAVVHRGTLDMPSPMAALETTSAGYVWVYHTETGEPSLINRNMLLPQLRDKVLPNGNRAFSLKQSRQPYRGTIKCALHADGPERPRYADMGFPECEKSNIPTQYQLLMHMQHKHPTAWKAIELERTTAETAEDRAFYRLILAEMVAKRGDSTATPPLPEPSHREAPPSPKASALCGICGKETYGSSQAQAESRLRLHSRKHR